MARVEGHDESLDVLDGYDGRVWPAIRSTSRFRIAAAGLLTLALSAAGGFYLGAHRYPTPAAVADEVVVLAVPGGRPSGAGLAAGSVWVTTWDGFVVRVDPETRKMVRIAVGGSPLAAQEGFGSVWVTNSADGTVTRINPADNRVQATIAVGPVPFQLAVAGGGMWVATQTAAVKIDPGSDRVIARSPYPHPRDAETPNKAGVGLDADERAVWVSTAVGTVLRLRPDDGRLVATIRVLPDEHTSPGSVAIDGDHVWVSNWAVDPAAGPGAGEPRLGRTVGVVDIDASSNQIAHRVSSAGYPVSGMLPRRGSLYMVGGYDGNHTSVLIRTDWPYDVLTSVRPVGGSSFDVVAANGFLWVPSWDEHALYLVPDVDGATG